MKHFRLLIGVSVIVCVLPSSTFSQSVPPGFVDGSTNPSGIPDSAAYRLVLLSLRRDTMINRLHLSAADAGTMKGLVAKFAVQYAAWSQSTAIGGGKGSSASEAQALAIVQQTVGLIGQQLTADGVSKFAQFVQKFAWLSSLKVTSRKAGIKEVTVYDNSEFLAVCGAYGRSPLHLVRNGLGSRNILYSYGGQRTGN